MTPPVGHKSGHVRTFSQDDFDRFARLSGDDNPIHVDPAFAARTRFGRTLAHGMMLFSVISGLIRRTYQDARIEDIELMFPGPTFVGDEMQIRLELELPSTEDGRARVAATITAPDGEPACVAKAIVDFSPRHS